MTNLTPEIIESGDYSINDVADLRMRLDIAERALSGISNAIQNNQQLKAYEIAVNAIAQINGEHNHDCDGEVSLGNDNKYSCMCCLIAGV